MLDLVRSFLAFFERAASRDLATATQALPQVAQIVELKLRLLLPRPPALEDDDLAPEEMLEVILELENLEIAIDFLRLRRDRRRMVLPARTEAPEYARPDPPLRIPVGRLTSLAARFRAGAYFEVAVERFSVVDAIRQLVRWLSGGRSRGRTFQDLTAGRGWPATSVLFAGLLELVKEGRVRAAQAESFGPIELDPVAVERQEVA